MTIAATTVLSSSVVKNEGVPFVSIYRLDAAKTAKGTSYTPDEVVAGAGVVYNALVLDRAMVASPSTPTYAYGDTRGGGAPGPSIALGLDVRGDETLTFAMDNLQLNALIENVTIDDSAAGLLVTGDNPQQKIFGNFGIIISSYEAGDNGIDGEYRNRCILNCGLTITQKRGETQDGGVNAQSTIITIKKNDSPRTPWGTLIPTTMGFPGNVTDVLNIHSRAPLTISTYVGLAADVGWTLPYLPLSEDTAADYNKFSADGVISVPTSISSTTGVIVTAAMADQEYWSVLYPTAFVASA